MPIRVLPPLLVNQIAAGEVIERPASVVKELIDNAIDAGATRIDVVLERGGKDLVQVTDDGRGIPFDELTLALSAHATSKIERAEDLDMIATMGFRGEALASIASIARVSLRSRTPGDERAGLIEGEGDQIQPPRPAAGGYGTSITVRNLFFNTPARRKFLKTDQTEIGRSAEVVRIAALGNPSVGFSLKSDGRVRLETPPEQAARARVLAILGRELEPELIEIQPRDAEPEAIGIWGLVGTPEIARGTNRAMRVFLNGRSIADRTIIHAIKEAYRGLIEPTRFPTVVLFLRMDPSTVDVNVHPAKAEVRFRNQMQVHTAVRNAVRDALRGADLTPDVQLAAGGGRDLGLAVPPRRADELGRGLPSPPVRHGAEFARRPEPREKGFVYRELKSALADEDPARSDTVSLDAIASPGEALIPRVRSVPEVLQVHRSFLVTQDAEGIVIVDQHALHERVMFEKLKERLGGGALPSQQLLVPAVLEVDAREMEALDGMTPLLERLGIDMRPMSPTSVGVHAFPSLLFERRVDPIDFMRDLTNRATGDGLADDPEAALHEVLDMMACKAAIKAGDQLEPAEMAELLEQREAIERASNCPHGRPTTLRLTIRDLERQFGRR